MRGRARPRRGDVGAAVRRPAVPAGGQGLDGRRVRDALCPDGRLAGRAGRAAGGRVPAAGADPGPDAVPIGEWPSRRVQPCCSGPRETACRPAGCDQADLAVRIPMRRGRGLAQRGLGRRDRLLPAGQLSQTPRPQKACPSLHLSDPPNPPARPGYRGACQRRGSGRRAAGEAEMVVEAQGRPVLGVHMEVHPPRSSFPQGGQLQADELRPIPPPWTRGSRSICRWDGKPVIEVVFGRPGVVDQVGELLVRRPALAVGNGGLGVADREQSPSGSSRCSKARLSSAPKRWPPTPAWSSSTNASAGSNRP